MWTYLDFGWINFQPSSIPVDMWIDDLAFGRPRDSLPRESVAHQVGAGARRRRNEGTALTWEATGLRTRGVVALGLVLSGAAGCHPDAAGTVADGEVARAPDGAADASGGCAVVAPSSHWATWPMPDSTSTVTASAPSYDVGVTGVVSDRVTGLTWQRAVSADSYGWAAAADHCACLRLAGHDDWRLPTRIELVSLIDVRRQSPAIDPSAFPDTPGEWFWTSSRAADDPAAAWYVAFFDGDTHHMDVETPYRVRCVRVDEAAVPARRAVVRDDGTVVDAATGLTWQRTADPALRTWSEAGAACAGLGSDGGASSWRLPTAKELQTLIDETRVDPAIDLTAFPDTTGDSFWTSSPLAGQDGYAWFVSFYAGVAYNSPTAEPHRARCVR